ncbi:MAG: hypothetical protein Q9169_008016, partial [Polycauliona sp. 2 TL-2023]
MTPPPASAEEAGLLEKQRKDNAKRRKREAKRNKKLQKRQLRVEVVVKEHEQQLVRRRTRHLLWRSFLDETAEPSPNSLKWLTLENMHDAIRGMWANQGFRDTARQIHQLPLNVDPDRFVEIATLVSPLLLLQMQTLKSQGSPYAYQVAEIFLRLMYTLPALVLNTPFSKLKGGQAIVLDPLLLELSLNERESIQDVYLKIRGELCKEGTTSSAKTAKEIQHDEILHLFQGLARVYCLQLEDVRDPLGAAHYLGFSRMRIPSLEKVKRVRFQSGEDDDSDISDMDDQTSTRTWWDGVDIMRSANGHDAGHVWLTVAVVLHPQALNTGYKRETHFGLIYIPEPNRKARIRQADIFAEHCEKLQGLRDLLRDRSGVQWTSKEQENIQWETVKLWTKVSLWTKEWETVQVQMD